MTRSSTRERAPERSIGKAPFARCAMAAKQGAATSSSPATGSRCDCKNERGRTRFSELLDQPFPDRAIAVHALGAQRHIEAIARNAVDEVQRVGVVGETVPVDFIWD